MSLSACFEQEYAYDSAKGGIVVPAYLSLNGKRAMCQAKVDPGAEYCLFAREFADRLEIEVESGYCLEMGTLTTPFTTYGHTVTLQTFHITVESMIFFPASYQITRNLLGRNGWLSKLKLGLVDYEERIYLSRYLPIG